MSGMVAGMKTQELLNGWSGTTTDHNVLSFRKADAGGRHPRANALKIQKRGNDLREKSIYE